jgi:hypothetical protein
MMRDSDAFLQEAAPYVDLWCPVLGAKHPQQIEWLRNTGKPLWSYTVGRRLLSPYSAYRLALWRAFDVGATGCGFWCYAVGEGWKNRDMWKESAGLYAVIYTLEGAPAEVSRREVIIPSRRWEAWREGIEDYTYLHLLREVVRNRRGSDGRDAITSAQRTLESAVREVLAEPEDVARADLHRRQVLHALVRLRRQEIAARW